MTSRTRSDTSLKLMESKTSTRSSVKDVLPPRSVKASSSINTNSKTTDITSSTRSRSISRKSPVRTSSPPKSPSRRNPIHKSPSRSSPSRKSPSRKSPSRKSPTRKSPTRKSPSRKNPASKSPTRSNINASKSLANASLRKSTRILSYDISISHKEKPSLIGLDTDSDGEYDSRINSEKPKAAVRGRARKLSSDFGLSKDTHTSTLEDVENYIGVVHRTSQRAGEVDHIQDAVKRLTEFSDEDDIPLLRKERSKQPSKSRYISRLIPAPREFGGWIGALLGTFVLPLFLISLFIFCNETHCSFTKLPNFEKYKSVSMYFNYTSVLVYLGFVTLLSILSSLPFGGPKVSSLPNKQGKLNYVMNGIFCAIVASLVFIALEYYKIPISSYILRNYFRLFICSLIFGILLSFYSYIRSFFIPISALNSYAVTESRIYNFWIGREINPRVLGILDLKVLQARICMVAVILINSIFIYKSIHFTEPIQLSLSTLHGIKCNSTLLVIATLQAVYALDFLIYEYTLISTFDLQYEGLGFMSILFSITAPFIMTIITKYVYDFQIELSIWLLVLAVILFSVGHTLQRGSFNQKHAFRVNPHDPSLSHLEKIPTAQGKKLLSSGYWGIVRHPNYLGDILMVLSFTLFALNSPIVIATLADIGFLIHRAHRDGKRCQERYGSAWNIYCQRVKYVLIPRVY